MKFFIFLTSLFYLSCSLSPVRQSSSRTPSSTTVLSGPVTLVYHRFDRPGLSTNIQPELFEKQMQYLIDQNFQFLDAEEAIAQLKLSSENKQENTYQEKSVIITFDDPYKSIYSVGRELFKKYKLPVTLFINTSNIGKPSLMNWQQINELLNDPELNIKIGCHSHKHANMPSTMNSQQMREDIQTCINIIEQQTKISPKLFAYPYGEYSEELIKVVKELGFIGAYAQYSGVIHESSDFFTLPRFPINDFYGRFKDKGSDFKLRVHTLPLPVSVKNQNMMRAHQLPVTVEFTLDPRLPAEQLRCYTDVKEVQNQNELSQHPKTMFRDGSHFTLQWNKKFSSRRQNINCTLWGKEGETPRFYWHSFKIGDPRLPER